MDVLTLVRAVGAQWIHYVPGNQKKGYDRGCSRSANAIGTWMHGSTTSGAAEAA